MNTIADCVVLDPNSDFRYFHDFQPAAQWRTTFDGHSIANRLHTEKSLAVFERRWGQVIITIRSQVLPYAFQGKEVAPIAPYQRIRIWWPSVPPEILLEDAGPTIRTEFYHCHAFVSAVVSLQRTIALEPGREFNALIALERAEEIYKKIRPLAEGPNYEDAARGVLSSYFTFPRLTVDKREEANLKVRFNANIIQVISEAKYVTRESATFYFGSLTEYRRENIIEATPPLSTRAKVDVMDLPSLRDRRMRFLAVYAKVSQELEAARNRWYESMGGKEAVKRVPTFIVLDEAHNFIPAACESKSEIVMRELFRTIAAEGRKYSVFLILATQRPDKLDPFVISECENKAIMRLDSKRIATDVNAAMGLDDVPNDLLTRCVKLHTGNVLIAGKWSDGRPRIFYCAARRTREGGSTIPAIDWAVQPADRI